MTLNEFKLTIADCMEKKFKLIINSQKCDIKSLTQFIEELEARGLGTFTNGEIAFDDKNENEISQLMDKYILNK